MNKIIFLFIISCAFISTQAQTLEGIITDEGNNPIADSYVYNSKGDIHAHSNQFGQFACMGLTPGDTIFFRFLGFKTLMRILDEHDFQTEIQIILQTENFELDQVIISNSVKSSIQVASIDLQIDPVNSSQEILRKVPGLFIGQHAGGGSRANLSPGI